jgi:hypothetical protein
VEHININLTLIKNKMKRLLLLGFLSLLYLKSTAQTTNSYGTTRTQLFHYDEFWISGSIGGGAVVSTNIINSGAVFPVRTEFLWQRRHRRLGVGFGKDLYVTPQSLFNLAVGGSPSISKLYFVYEQFLFKNFPINLGFSSHLGFFSTSDTTSSQTKRGFNSSKGGGLFGDVGCVLELGIRPFYLFARPAIEYQSWSGLHKQLQATASIGIRLKFLSSEEKARRAEKKMKRKSRR